MFDTGQAARLLGFPSAGLAYLLTSLAGVTSDKRYQLADWRVRPLSPEMQHYARSDTHYLLYCYDRLKAALVEAGEAIPAGWALPLPRDAPQVCACRVGGLAGMGGHRDNGADRTMWSGEAVPPTTSCTVL